MISTYSEVIIRTILMTTVNRLSIDFSVTATHKMHSEWLKL